jgi:hypothetical protein
MNPQCEPPLIDASNEGDGARRNITVVLAAGTIRSSVPTTKRDGTRRRRTAADALMGAVSAAASVTTVSTDRLRVAASSATPPPMEWPATASRDGSTLPRGTTRVPRALCCPSQRRDRLRSSARRTWLGDWPVSLSGAITT